MLKTNRIQESKNVTRKLGLGLPLTHKYRRGNLIFLQQCEALTHELELSIAMPEKLMSWRGIVVAPEVPADLGNQPDGFT